MVHQGWILSPINSFIVVDTEGQETLTEIAVLDHQGQLLYEAWVKKNTLTPNGLRKSLKIF